MKLHKEHNQLKQDYKLMLQGINPYNPPKRQDQHAIITSICMLLCGIILIIGWLL